MIVECEKCKKNYKLNLGSAKASTAQFTCKACGHVTQVSKTAQVSSEPSPSDNFSNAAVSGPAQSNIDVSWKDSIKAKLGAVLILASVIILGAYSLFNYYATKSQLTAELTQYAENTAKRLALTLIVPVWEVDENEVAEIIKSEMLDKRIYAVAVHEKEATEVFQAAARTADWQVQKISRVVQGGHIRSRQNIKKEGELLGNVEVMVTERFMRATIIQSTKQLFVAVVIQIIVLLAAMYIALKKLLIDPVAKLTLATEQISLGNLVTTIGIRSRDEMGILAHAIERMQTSLRIVMKRYK